MDMKRIVVFGLVAALAGCAASQYRPIVDLQGADPYLYEQDLADCQSYARQVDPGANAVAGAAVGALIGAAFGVGIGDSGDYARTGAAIGAVDGAIAGGAGSAATQVDIIRNCMAGRGYVVLN
jgi:hypothetical protein